MMNRGLISEYEWQKISSLENGEGEEEIIMGTERFGVYCQNKCIHTCLML